jgi:hypothetical protein
LNELSSYSSRSQQPNIITGLSQTPITDTISPPVTIRPVKTTQVPSLQQQEQRKEENLNPLTSFVKLFITSTFMVQDYQRRVSEGQVEDFVIFRLELSSTRMIASTSDNKNNSSKKRESNPTTENTKQEELEEDTHDIEEEVHLSSKPN